MATPEQHDLIISDFKAERNELTEKVAQAIELLQPITDAASANAAKAVIADLSFTSQRLAAWKNYMFPFLVVNGSHAIRVPSNIHSGYGNDFAAELSGYKEILESQVLQCIQVPIDSATYGSCQAAIRYLSLIVPRIAQILKSYNALSVATSPKAPRFSSRESLG